jgi:2-polyprenyl-6-methoxyphenol hydroxylase-like FAD-dependent oxidoreductase
MPAVNSALVIGGGIAGPVTALALRKAGIDAEVFEAYSAGADDVGAMLSIAPNGQAALAVVGADEAVREAGQPVPGMVMGNAAGFRFLEFGGFPGLPPSIVLHRADLYRAVRDFAVSNGITIHHGKRLVSASHDGAGVTAHFADGSSASADILIGADGIRSTVRGLIDPDAPGPEHQGVLSFGGRVTGSEVSTEDGVMYFIFGNAFIGYWRLRDDSVVWFGSLPSKEPLSSAQARQTPAPVWLDQLRDLYGDDPAAKELLARTSPDDLFVLGSMEMMPPVPNWHDDRMVLVGDSAHAPSSSSGQGASQALESAIELARCLRDLPDAPSAFAAYEKLRRPRVEAIAAAAAGTNRRKARAGADDAPPQMPTAEQMFGAVHRHTISWDEHVK